MSRSWTRTQRPSGAEGPLVEKLYQAHRKRALHVDSDLPPEHRPQEPQSARSDLDDVLQAEDRPKRRIRGENTSIAGLVTSQHLAEPFVCICSS